MSPDVPGPRRTGPGCLQCRDLLEHVLQMSKFSVLVPDWDDVDFFKAHPGAPPRGWRLVLISDWSRVIP